MRVSDLPLGRVRKYGSAVAMFVVGGVANGVQTVAMDNSKFATGPIALQYAMGVKGAKGGPIKWRKVQVRSL